MTALESLLKDKRSLDTMASTEATKKHPHNKEKRGLAKKDQSIVSQKLEIICLDDDNDYDENYDYDYEAEWKRLNKCAMTLSDDRAGNFSESSPIHSKKPHSRKKTLRTKKSKLPQIAGDNYEVKDMEIETIVLSSSSSSSIINSSETNNFSNKFTSNNNHASIQNFHRSHEPQNQRQYSSLGYNNTLSSYQTAGPKIIHPLLNINRFQNNNYPQTTQMSYPGFNYAPTNNFSPMLHNIFNRMLTSIPKPPSQFEEEKTFRFNKVSTQPNQLHSTAAAATPTTCLLATSASIQTPLPPKQFMNRKTFNGQQNINNKYQKDCQVNSQKQFKNSRNNKKKKKFEFLKRKNELDAKQLQQQLKKNTPPPINNLKIFDVDERFLDETAGSLDVDYRQLNDPDLVQNKLEEINKEVEAYNKNLMLIKERRLVSLVSSDSNYIKGKKILFIFLKRFFVYIALFRFKIQIKRVTTRTN